VTDEEEDVGSYWMTLRKGEDTVIWKRKLCIAQCAELALGRGLGPVVRQTSKWINMYAWVGMKEIIVTTCTVQQ
jgi:hypothetical protein